ncbi:ABC transporter ATP-binding protein [Comamonas odontotermitis]|uniref:ABC transporter ATP-binding protein n=1 Tax=Comamonas odontotermitis TaxID=379895 RepID=UPI003752769D
MLQAQGLHFAVGQRAIVQDAALHVSAGECVGLIGPNGCGKSTLLRMLYRVLPPHRGVVRLEGQDVWQMDARAFARQAAVLAQNSAPAFDSTAQEAVMLGRLPHQGRFAADSVQDRRIVTESLERVGAAQLAGQSMATLSGGERQRVLLARALAQQPRLLFLDEPTNHLDIRYQLELMRLVRSLQLTVLVVLHDLNIAAQFCDRLYLMEAGALVANGAPREVLTPEAMARVFGVRATIDDHPATGRPRIAYWMEWDGP